MTIHVESVGRASFSDSEWCCCSWIRSYIDSLTNVLVPPSPLCEPLSTQPKCVSMPTSLPLYTHFFNPWPCFKREQKRDSCVYLRNYYLYCTCLGSIRLCGLWFSVEIASVPKHLSAGEHQHCTQDYTQRCHDKVTSVVGKFEAPDISKLPRYKLAKCRLCRVAKFGEIGILTITDSTGTQRLRGFIVY